MTSRRDFLGALAGCTAGVAAGATRSPRASASTADGVAPDERDVGFCTET